MHFVKAQIPLYKIALIFGSALFLSSCANTKISQSWVEPNHKKAYNDILVIGIAESQQNRRAYESYFVEELQTVGVEGEASYKLVKDSKIDREIVTKAIKGLEIDAVIVTHLVGVDEETVYRPSMDYMPMYGGGYYGGLYSYYPHVNTYVHRPGYYTTHETYTLETNLYDVESEELVWSARSRTFAPESVDEVITDLTKLLIKDLSEKNLIKKK
ncbi:hypothetical protein MNBD_GAMMA05-547 [hydrothermal vent metagenome]|uniref:DUF4136 domain-containing protein n=1 Tax=hydrothermal vent metagenome TaxID=652676 RepID=A0A3B0WUA7_9ZZZZ